MGFYNYIGGPNPRRGSKSASGLGPPGVHIRQRIWTGGSKSASKFGPGGPNLGGGSKSARTPGSRHRLFIYLFIYYFLLFFLISFFGFFLMTPHPAVRTPQSAPRPHVFGTSKEGKFGLRRPIHLFPRVHDTIFCHDKCSKH